MTIDFKVYDGRVRPLAFQQDEESCLAACLADVAADLLGRPGDASNLQRTLASVILPGMKHLVAGAQVVRVFFPSLRWDGPWAMSLDEAMARATPRCGVIVGLHNLGTGSGHAVRILGGSMPRAPNLIRQVRYFDPFPYADGRFPVVEANFQEVEARYIGAGGLALLAHV